MLHPCSFPRWTRRAAAFACLLLGFGLGWASARPGGSAAAPVCRQEDLTLFPDTAALEGQSSRPAAAKAEAESVPPEQKRVALTFDDGPSRNTPAVLETLEQYGVPATFFVSAAGYNEEYLPLLVQARQAGHQIALHSASHEYSQIYRSPEAFWADIALLQARLAPYLDSASIRYLRFPGGSTNTVSRKYGGSGIMEQLKQQAEEKGFVWVDWNVCGEDAAGEKLSAAEIYRNVVRSTGGRQTCIVLLHDSAATDTTPDALPDIIGWYLEEGYRFCTVAELYGK